MPRTFNFRSSKPFWAAVLLIAAAAAWPLLSHVGLLNTRGGGDSPFLLQRLHQLTTALADGHFPVRWMPDANYGYGYPFYNYYAPLSIYIAAIFRFLGFTFVGAIKAAQLAGFITAGLGAFLLGRKWFNNNYAGLLAAAAYTFAPFHMVNVYVRGDSLAEFWAMAFYPLLLLTADRLVNHPKRPFNIALFALTYAALILSHNISALIFSPFLLLYIAFAYFKRISQSEEKPPSLLIHSQSILLIILALLLGFALSAWFWLPALGEQAFAQLEPVTAGYFHYSNHFRGANLVQTSFLFDYDVAEGGAFRMGLLQLLFTLSGLAFLLLYVNKKRGISLLPTLFITISFLLATLMITPLSRPLWDNLPLLPFTQFPWRFLSVQALFGAMAAAGLSLLPRDRIIVPILVTLIVLSGIGALKTDHLYLTDADITAEQLAQYEWFTGNIGSTVSAEYLPSEVQPRAFTSPWINTGFPTPVVGLDSPIGSEPIRQETAEKSWQINTPSPTSIVLPVLNWPGWQAEIDGSQTSIQPAPGSGLIMIELPRGEHTVSLRLTPTPIRLTAELISLITFLAILALLSRNIPRSINRTHLKWSAVALIAFLLIRGFTRFGPPPPFAFASQTWDFEQFGYLNRSPNGIPFERDFYFEAYHYSQNTVRSGEEFSITIGWKYGSGMEPAVDLVTPAIHRFQSAPILASQTIQLSEDSLSTFTFTIPENAPAGLYIPRLTLDGVSALTGSEQTRGDLYLRPFWIIDDGQEAESPTSSLDARTFEVTYQSDNTLLAQLQWLTQKQLTENYNVSLRLVDNNGSVVVQQDTQPGFGFLPSSGWQPGQWHNDWLTLPLPIDFTAEQNPGPFSLVARLYEVKTEQVVLTRQLGELTWQDSDFVFAKSKPIFEPPANIHPAAATFDDLIQLQGYDLAQTPQRLALTLYWQNLMPGEEDFFHFVHLVDPITGNIVAQHDSMPRNNTYPTSQWLPDEIIPDSLTLDISEVPPGQYQLYVGLYRNLGDTFPTLTAFDENGQPIPDNRLLLDEITVP